MVTCCIAWCCALCAPETDACAVHRKMPLVHPASLAPDERYMYVRIEGTTLKDDLDCASCGGTGRCDDCDGTGDHACAVIGCCDVHECGTCGGDGVCADCVGTGAQETTHPGSLLSPTVAFKRDADRLAAKRYLRAVYLPVWMPFDARAGVTITLRK